MRQGKKKIVKSQERKKRDEERRAKLKVIRKEGRKN